jgi:hypothetical protein
MSQTIQKNLLLIKNTAQKFYDMSPGEPIENPDKLLPLFKIKKQNHQHSGFTVFISHRALKHFVERRKIELNKSHSDIQAIRLIYFIIECLHECISNYDSYTFERYFKHFYSRSFLTTGKPTIRVLVEIIEGKVEIISMHYRKK